MLPTAASRLRSGACALLLTAALFILTFLGTRGTLRLIGGDRARQSSMQGPVPSVDPRWDFTAGEQLPVYIDVSFPAIPCAGTLARGCVAHCIGCD